MRLRRMTGESELDERTTVRFTLKGWWWMVSTVFILGATVSGFQYNMAQQLKSVIATNSVAHDAILKALSDVDIRQRLYILRREMIDVMVYEKRMDAQNAGAPWTLTDEDNYRKQLQSILSRQKQP